MLSLSQVHKEIQAIFDGAKVYDAAQPIQNGVYIVFERVDYESTMVGNYSFKILCAGNSLDKSSKGVLPLCDEMSKIADKHHANCIENALGSQLHIVSVVRSEVREGLFCYEIALKLRVRFA